MKYQNDQKVYRPPSMSIAPPSTFVAPQSPPPTMDKSAEKAITTGRKINFSFLLQEGFQVGEMMKKMTWKVLCSLDQPNYPALMKKFYNIFAKENNGIYGIVSGITIKIDEEILRRILHMSTDGIAPA